MSFPLYGYEKTLLFNIQTIQGGVRNYNSCFNFEIKMRLTVTTLGIPLFKFIVFNMGYFYSNLFSSTIFMLN